METPSGTGSAGTVHIMGMDLDQTPPVRILSEGRARQFSQRRKFGSQTGNGSDVRFIWFFEEGVADEDIRFLAHWSIDKYPNQWKPYTGKYSDLEKMPNLVRECGEKLHALIASGSFEGEFVRRDREMHRTLFVPWAKATDGTLLPKCTIFWRCPEGEDRSNDRYTVSLQSASGEEIFAPYWSGTGEAGVDRMDQMPDWLMQLVEDCRRDLLAWVPDPMQ